MQLVYIFDSDDFLVRTPVEDVVLCASLGVAVACIVVLPDYVLALVVPIRTKQLRPQPVRDAPEVQRTVICSSSRKAQLVFGTKYFQ
jgi:hypothetical protein